MGGRDRVRWVWPVFGLLGMVLLCAPALARGEPGVRQAGAGQATGVTDAGEIEHPERSERIVVTPIITRGPIDAEQVEGLELVLGQSLQSDDRVRAIMPSEIQTLLSLEAQKQLAGCEADASCLAEIGGALGAPYVVAPVVSRVGSTWILQLTLLDAEDGSPLHRATREADDLDDLVSALHKAATEILGALPATDSTEPGSRTPGSGEGSVRFASRYPAVFWSGLGVGVAASAVGVVLWQQNEHAIEVHNRVASTLQRDPSASQDGLMTLGQAESAKTARTVGFVVLGGGAALIAADLVWGTAHSRANLEAALMPVPGGAMAMLAWEGF